MASKSQKPILKGVRKEMGEQILIFKPSSKKHKHLQDYCVLQCLGKLKGICPHQYRSGRYREALWQYQVLVKSLEVQQTRNMNENACFVS